MRKLALKRSGVLRSWAACLCGDIGLTLLFLHVKSFAKETTGEGRSLRSFLSRDLKDAVVGGFQ